MVWKRRSEDGWTSQTSGARAIRQYLAGRPDGRGRWAPRQEDVGTATLPKRRED